MWVVDALDQIACLKVLRMSNARSIMDVDSVQPIKRSAIVQPVRLVHAIELSRPSTLHHEVAHLSLQPKRGRIFATVGWRRLVRSTVKSTNKQDVNFTSSGEEGWCSTRPEHTSETHRIIRRDTVRLLLSIVIGQVAGRMWKARMREMRVK